MNVDITIRGYVTDGAFFHPQCLPDDINPAADDTVSALFSWMDDEVHGTTCDHCSEYIFEPSEPHAFRANPHQLYGRDDGLCFDCCQPLDDEQMHPTATADPDTEIGHLILEGFTPEQAGQLAMFREKFADRPDWTH